MRLYLINFFLIFLLIFNVSTYANEFKAEYIVKTSGIKIGKFSWSLNMGANKYETKIYLKNSGIFSSIYKFKGEYKSLGIIDKNKFKSKEYKQYWKTNKKVKIVEMVFDNYLTKLSQKPEEKELARVDLDKLLQHHDPLTSFINILNGNEFAKTIDGRRVYTMKKIELENSQKFSIEITKYKNIWADHKRNDLEKIEFFLDEKNFFPKEINIFFKNRIFRLKKR